MDDTTAAQFPQLLDLTFTLPTQDADDTDITRDYPALIRLAHACGHHAHPAILESVHDRSLMTTGDAEFAVDEARTFLNAFASPLGMWFDYDPAQQVYRLMPLPDAPDETQAQRDAFIAQLEPPIDGRPWLRIA